MTLPKPLKELTLKDWIWILGALASVVGSWFVLKSDVDGIKVHAASFEARQEKVDMAQDDRAKETKKEILDSLNRNSDEIKLEIRELRKEISRR